MARKVIDYMNRIYEVLIHAISDEDTYRVVKVQRHIKAQGEEDIVVDFVKNAIIKKIPIPDFRGCVFAYKETHYFLVPTEYSVALQEIGFDEYIISEENLNNEKEIIQGCEMLAISEGILGINPKFDSLDLIEMCLGNEGEEGIVSFDFSYLRDFFISSSIFIMDDSRFSLQYQEDFYRLCCYCLCCQKESMIQGEKESIKNLLLLKSSRSIAASIINGLRSPLKEYTFLQYYQCLEYLFRLNNSFHLQDEFSVGVLESIGIVTGFDFKLSENENLRRVIVSNTDETEIDKYFNDVGDEINSDDSKEKKCELVASKIYKIRCQIAHLRYGQDTYLDRMDWEKQITGVIGLVFAIYQKCDSRIEESCRMNNAWHEIDYTHNDRE